MNRAEGEKTAQIEIAEGQAKARVLVAEAGAAVGGGARTAEAFGAGIRRDVCSAVHPTGLASPVFADLGLSDHGLEWFYRFLQEPRRMFRRYFIEDMAFVALFAREWVRR